MMINKYKKSRLLIFLILIFLVALIAFLSSWGLSLAREKETTSTTVKNTSRSGAPGLQLTIVAHQSTASNPAIAPTTPAATPAAAQGSGTFTTLPPGSALPGDSVCATRIGHSAEIRPDNTTANNTNLYTQGYRLTGSDISQYGYQQRVTGNFTGTTDEILQWGACKWGIDVDIVRAQAEKESHWHQSELGDCNRGPTQPDTSNCQSVGILQVKGADLPPTHPGTYPYARESTAFDVDYMLAVLRSCFEGKETWLGNGYHAGDIWGCVGRWFSGDWYQSSQDYIAQVQALKASRDWLNPGY